MMDIQSRVLPVLLRYLPLKFAVEMWETEDPHARTMALTAIIKQLEVADCARSQRFVDLCHASFGRLVRLDLDTPNVKRLLEQLLRTETTAWLVREEFALTPEVLLGLAPSFEVRRCFFAIVRQWNTEARRTILQQLLDDKRIEMIEHLFHFCNYELKTDLGCLLSSVHLDMFTDKSSIRRLCGWYPHVTVWVLKRDGSQIDLM